MDSKVWRINQNSLNYVCTYVRTYIPLKTVPSESAENSVCSANCSENGVKLISRSK